MSMSRRYKWWKAESGDPNHICVLIAGRTKRIKLQSKLATGQTDWSFMPDLEQPMPEEMNSSGIRLYGDGHCRFFK